MDCRQVNHLLPLWIGQDLPDASTADQVVSHLKECRECDDRRKSIQSSLDVLQRSLAESLDTETARQSVWPGLMVRISDWEQRHRRDRFNGWIPASVMALAVGLMVAVSLPSINDELFNGPSPTVSTQDLFGTVSQSERNAAREKSSATKPASNRGEGLTKPVNFGPEQW